VPKPIAASSQLKPLLVTTVTTRGRTTDVGRPVLFGLEPSGTELQYWWQVVDEARCAVE
jgi:hypothetical protein